MSTWEQNRHGCQGRRLLSGGHRVQLTGILPSPDLDGNRFLIRTDRADAREIPVPIRVTPKP
jgi:hypothetical protein